MFVFGRVGCVVFRLGGGVLFFLRVGVGVVGF